ncbi:hypothetical protein D9M72_440450 [compost metagenome]
MRGEDDEGARIVAKLEEQRDARHLDTAGRRALGVEIEQTVEEHVFGRHAAHVAPALKRDRVDLRLAFLRKSVAQVGERQLLPAGLRPDEPQGTIHEADRGIGRKHLQDRQQQENELRDQPLAGTIRRQHQPCDQHAHVDQSIFRMILPKIWRDSMRSSARSI